MENERILDFSRNLAMFLSSVYGGSSEMMRAEDRVQNKRFNSNPSDSLCSASFLV